MDLFTALVATLPPSTTKLIKDEADISGTLHVNKKYVYSANNLKHDSFLHMT